MKIVRDAKTKAVFFEYTSEEKKQMGLNSRVTMLEKLVADMTQRLGSLENKNNGEVRIDAKT